MHISLSPCNPRRDFSVWFFNLMKHKLIFHTPQDRMIIDNHAHKPTIIHPSLQRFQPEGIMDNSLKTAYTKASKTEETQVVVLMEFLFRGMTIPINAYRILMDSPEKCREMLKSALNSGKYAYLPVQDKDVLSPIDHEHKMTLLAQLRKAFPHGYLSKQRAEAYLSSPNELSLALNVLFNRWVNRMIEPDEAREDDGWRETFSKFRYDSDFNQKHFPLEPECESRDLDFFCFNGISSGEQALELFKQEGWSPGRLRSSVNHVLSHLDRLHEAVYMAVGAQWVRPTDGRTYVPVFTKDAQPYICLWRIDTRSSRICRYLYSR